MTTDHHQTPEKPPENATHNTTQNVRTTKDQGRVAGDGRAIVGKRSKKRQSLVESGDEGGDGAQIRRVRRKMLQQLEDVAGDLDRLLEQARIWADQEGKIPRCEACGAALPKVTRIKLPHLLAVIRELRAVLPSQHEVVGILAGVDPDSLSNPIVERLAQGEHPAVVMAGYLPGLEGLEGS